MPQNIAAVSVTGTKMASGTVQLVFTINNAIRFACVIPSADFTSFNTTVNGGAGGATLTKTYAQDAAIGDYPLEYVSGA